MRVRRQASSSRSLNPSIHATHSRGVMVQKSEQGSNERELWARSTSHVTGSSVSLRGSVSIAALSVSPLFF